MNKIILGLAAAAAVAAPLALSAGSASAATTDASGVVTVSKGEIMAQLPSMNEAAFQAIAMEPGQSLTGSSVFTATTTTGVRCTDGITKYHYRNTILTSPIALTEVFNGSANKVTGWNLGAKGASVITESNTGGTRFPDYSTICDGHGGTQNPLQVFTQSHSDVTTFAFDGAPVSIVVNPYVPPVV